MDAIEQALIQRTAPNPPQRGTTGAPVAEFMTLEQMLARFVLVSSGKQVVVLPADEMTGQRALVLQLDEAKERYLTSGEMVQRPDGTQAWVSFFERWRNSEDRVIVDSMTLAIGRPRFLKDANHVDAVNLWTPRVRREPKVGWEQKVRPFLEHMAYLVPNEQERTRHIQWLAHIEQRPAELPHHGYLHYTPQFGIGRSWLGKLFVATWPGEVALGVDVQGLFESEFNGEIAGKRLIIPEETHISGTFRESVAMENKLRHLITAKFRRVNPKYGRQYDEHNAARWLMFTNHPDGLPMPEDDRRFAVIANPTEKHPGGDDYYTRLHALLDDPEFIDAVGWYLATLDIRSFNPGEKPPMNAAKQAAIDATTPELQKELRAVIADWPSSIAATPDLMEACGVPPGDQKAASHFGIAMRKLGCTQLPRVRVDGKPTRVWLLKGKGEPPTDVAAEVKRYRNAEPF
jgi:hypothetical protein